MEAAARSILQRFFFRAILFFPLVYYLQKYLSGKASLPAIKNQVGEEELDNMTLGFILVIVSVVAIIILYMIFNKTFYGQNTPDKIPIPSVR